jgi:hypothetical protein
MASVPFEARPADWARVRMSGPEGWVDQAAPLPETARPGRGSYLGRHAAEPGGDLLSRVTRRLGLRRPNGRAGAFELYTDVEDQRLLRLLDGAAEPLAATPSWPRASATSSPASPRLLSRLGRDWPEIETACGEHRRTLQAELDRLTR